MGESHRLSFNPQLMKHTNCRVCGSSLIPYLDLGMMPLSNNLLNSLFEPCDKFPLQVMFCETCGLSQLSEVIEPEKLFSKYAYRSSISQGYKDHCRAMAIDLKEKFNLDSKSFHIDIAGNDGALLTEFRKVIGGRMLNIDPAKNLRDICEAANIPTLTAFWGMDVAALLKYNHADLITATNVFAHVDNVKEFIKAAKSVLKPTGHLVLEFPYLINFIEEREFDTVYFEHLSYFSISPLKRLCNSEGLEVLSVEEYPIHGGSVRVIIGYGEPDETVDTYIKIEEYYRNIEPYLEFAEDVKKIVSEFVKELEPLSNIAGFAASAKGNILLNAAGITLGKVRYIVDETPEKIGKYSPGTNLPIISFEAFLKNPPDHLIILSWNFLDEIVSKCRAAGYKGNFIHPKKRAGININYFVS